MLILRLISTISKIRRSDRGTCAVHPREYPCRTHLTFAEIRDSAGLKFGPNPPPFHEIRSLASRLYEKERREEFAQRLLGHKNLTMTQKYLDARGAEYVMV